ncbi:MAG: cytochrome b/b6 domain-containing protein [Proteobacteria bacterium]|nr:cytochrome b/b6 domain-containing protein [Pseudomonadota bacterium]
MSNKIYVWDPLVRLFHWTLVFSFIVAYVSGEDESLTHIYAGYLIMGLITFRIIWGLIGSKHARFSDFITSPAETLRYAGGLFTGKAKHYLGHNPLGGWMIIALLISLIITSITGLKLYGVEGHGPLAQSQTMSQPAIGNNTLIVLTNGRDHDDDDNEHEGRDGHEDDDEAEDFWEEIHEFFANLTLLLVLLHISGVIFSSARESQNLVKAMITGYKRQ